MVAKRPRMPDEEIVKFLRAVRFSDPRERQARRAAVTINSIAKRSSVTNSLIYEIVAGKSRLNDRIRQTIQQLTEM